MDIKNCRKWMMSVCLFVLLCMPSVVFAAQQTVEADGYYIIGDGAEENFSVARERAKQDALGRAAEMAAVYVEKCTAVKNHKLTASEIKTLAAKVLNVMDTVFENTTEGNVFKIRCHVVARVEDDETFASLLSDRQQLEESLQRERAKDEQIAKLNRQMEELKRQYQNAKTDSERAEIRRQAQTNDTGFTAAQWVERGIRLIDKLIEWNNNRVKQARLTNLGELTNLRETRECYEAIECFNKAIALDPDCVEAYVNLGKIYTNSHEYSEAIECYKKIVALKPDDVKAYMSLAANYSNLEWRYSIKGESNKAIEFYNKAIEFYNKVIEVKPNYVGAYLSLAYVYRKHGESQKAIECENKAIEVKPDDATSFQRLAIWYEEKQEKRKAIECLTKAIELRPDYPPYYYGRGRCYEELGDRKAAKQDYAKAYELRPNVDSYAKKLRESENW